MTGRPLLLTSLYGLAAGGVLGGCSVRFPGLGLGAAHSHLLVAGFLLPALAYLQFLAAQTYLRATFPASDGRILAGFYAAAAALLCLGDLLARGPGALLAFGGALALVAGGAWQAFVATLAVAAAAPPPSDGLGKGDGACVKQLRFAHLFLMVGLVLWALSAIPGLDAWTGAPRLRVAGLHALLAGYGLLSTYALSHLVVPRLSGVPAIAAGAIKGELHSTLLGVLLLGAGMLGGGTAWVVAGGLFVFFGAFVFMGVLGANIMKNKSATQRVTREFAYVPWTFAGVFWLVAGVLLGVFLNAVPSVLAHLAPGLRFVHIHAVLLGGFAQLVLGFATRLLPSPGVDGIAAVPFRRTRWAFYALNLGLLAMVVGRLAGGLQDTTFQVGVVLALAGLAAWFLSMRPHLAARVNP